MYKQSPSRSHRSKRIKVKHILQVCFLLGVFLWLIYQVKHSHENKKEFDSKDGKLVGKVQADSEIQRFGRKDLPRLTELATDVEKDGEDEEEKEVEEEEDNKHEEDEPEKEDNKHEEDDGRGGGDDEIDENDTERTNIEAEHEEESVDEDKDREENEGVSEESHTDSEENEDVLRENLSENVENDVAGKDDHTESDEREDVSREDHNEDDAASEDQDHGVDTNTHEAREEQYKADDASSEVAHDIQTVIPETGNLTRGSEIWDKVNFGQGNETQSPDKDDVLIQSGLQAGVDMNNNVTSYNATVTEQNKYEIDSNKSEDSPFQNSTLPSLPSDQPENGSNSTHIHGELSASLLSNETQTELPSGLSQNVTGEGAKHEDEHTSKSELAEVSPNKPESASRNAGQDLNPSNTTSDPSHKTNKTDVMEAAEHNSLHAAENLSNSGTSGSDESSKSHHSHEGAGGVQHDPIDTSHSSLHQEETIQGRFGHTT